MKKLLLTLGILLIASQCWAYTAISPDHYITPDDVTIARLDGNQNIIVNAINNFDGGNIIAGSITASQLDDNASPVKRWDESFNDYVYTGLLSTTSVSLTTTTSAGTAYIQGTRIVKDATSKTYTASRWTFVDISNNGTYTYSAVAIGGSTPTVAANSMRLFRVSSDATTIPDVRDDRVVGITLSIQDEYRSGLNISVVSPDAITLNSGIVYNGATRLQKTSNTVLALGTASDWVGGISGRATSTYGYVVIDSLGSIKLTTTAPTKSDTLGNTAGNLRYSVISGAYWRALSRFYMNAEGSGNIENIGAAADRADGTVKTQVGFGAWVTGGEDTITRATSDGFVVAISGNNSVIEGFTDGNNPPTTKRVNQTANVSGSYYTVTMPVRKGDFWYITDSGSATSVYWISLGD